MSQLTIVMYHYVRDIEHSRYPDIKGRRISEFRAQLDFLAAQYSIVTAEHVFAAAKGLSDLPPKAAWLTFDDGYLDHYATVFPLLHDRGWQGSFFPPARSIVARELLDVNKIHFVLAAQRNVGSLIDAIEAFVNERQGQSGIQPFQWYWKTIDKDDRHDSAEVIFVKRMLQRALPEELRTELSDDLFAKNVSVDQAAFCNELYMTTDQLKVMRQCGMCIGSHGGKHYWLDQLAPEDQAADIDRSLSFLASLGVPLVDWIMCYPYGAYNADTIRLLRARGCAVGVTTKVATADLSRDDPLELPRLDTNDLPYI